MITNPSGGLWSKENLGKEGFPGRCCDENTCDLIPPPGGNGLGAAGTCEVETSPVSR